VKIEKTACTNPTVYVFEIPIPPGSIYGENCGRFHQKKFKKMVNKAISTAKMALFGHL